MLIEKYNSSSRFSSDDILRFIQSVDEDFLPKLSERVDLVAYAQKLVDKAEMYVAHEGGTILGMVAFYLDRLKDQGYLTFMGVSEAARARGSGSALLQICIDSVREAGLRYLRTQTWSTNERALNWYVANGFRVTGQAADRAGGVISVFIELRC